MDARIRGYLSKLKEVREQNIWENAISHSETQNVSSTFVGGFTVKTTTQLICDSQNTNKTNVKTTITIKHDKFLIALSQCPPYNHTLPGVVTDL